MAEPYIGEIRMLGFNFNPKNYATCSGQILAINQNQALFSILGTTYGGNGTTTFALPDLRGRTPIHWGSGPGLPGVSLGQVGGEENHLLTVAEMPVHNHGAVGSSNAPDASQPAGNYWAAGQVYATAQNASMSTAALANTGGSQPHNNMQPYLVVNFSIVLFGVFPSRN